MMFEDWDDFAGSMSPDDFVTEIGVESILDLPEAIIEYVEALDIEDVPGRDRAIFIQELTVYLRDNLTTRPYIELPKAKNLQWVKASCEYCDAWFEVEIDVGSGYDTVKVECPACGDLTGAYARPWEEEK